MNFNDINAYKSNFRLKLENSTMMDRIKELETEIQYLKDQLQSYEKLILNTMASSDEEDTRSEADLNVNNKDITGESDLNVNNKDITGESDLNVNNKDITSESDLNLLNTSSDIYIVYSQLYTSYEELTTLYNQINNAYNQIKQDYDSLHNMYENLALAHKQIKLKLSESTENNITLQYEYDKLNKLYIELKNKSNSDDEYVKIDY